MDEQSNKILNLSKVTPKQIAKNSGVWIIAAVISILVILLLFTHKKGKASKPDHHTYQNNYSTALDTNLRVLRTLKDTPKKSDQLEDIILPTDSSEPDPMQLAFLERQKQERIAHTRELELRINAPSSFFVSGESKGGNKLLSNLIDSKNTLSSVFAEHNNNSDFANQKLDVETVKATQITHPNNTIAQGELIQAVLETPINSDLPGMVRAVTNQPVYAYTGNQPLIPAGTRLIGQYSSGIMQGQSRVMVLWNRAILPNGTSLQLHSPSTDDQGISGQGADSINRHFWAQFGEATLLSILGAGTATAGVNGDDQYNSLSYYRTSMSQSLNNTASNILDKTLTIKPTLIIHQGTQINVFVARDLDLDNALNQG